MTDNYPDLPPFDPEAYPYGTVDGDDAGIPEPVNELTLVLGPGILGADITVTVKATFPGNVYSDAYAGQYEDALVNLYNAVTGPMPDLVGTAREFSAGVGGRAPLAQTPGTAAGISAAVNGRATGAGGKEGWLSLPGKFTDTFTAPDFDTMPEESCRAICEVKLEEMGLDPSMFNFYDQRKAALEKNEAIASVMNVSLKKEYKTPDLNLATRSRYTVLRLNKFDYSLNATFKEEAPYDGWKNPVARPAIVASLYGGAPGADYGTPAPASVTGTGPRTSRFGGNR